MQKISKKFIFMGPKAFDEAGKGVKRGQFCVDVQE
jgi:hypothetical protein